jgi:SAM-dependent methyltransferase
MTTEQSTGIVEDPARLARAYNDIAYTSYPNFASHPDHLASVATLFGLDVAPVASSRVLELACGDGINLLPAAAALPRANFVGVDIAARPLEVARRMAGDLALTNVRLLQLDLRKLPANLGSFDYIIAHGLYSWIPEDVRAEVLPLIARHLAPNGVAFVSYNTLPGCHARRAVWEMLKYHTRATTDPSARLAAARALIALVSSPLAGEDEIQAALRAEVRLAGEGGDAVLAHDDMSVPNDPVYFHEFMADAARSGLAFLAEARLSAMASARLAPEVRRALAPLDRLEREQYLDFIHFRRYRESLLCHAGALSRFVVQPPRALRLHVVPSLTLRRAVANPDTVPTADPQVTAIMQMLLARWPRSLPAAELADWRERTLPADAGSSRRPIEFVLTELFVADLIDLHTEPVAAAAVPGERPEAFAPSRWISRDRDVVPTLYHEPLRLNDPTVRKVVGLLDGTRTRDDLVKAIGGPLAGPDGGAQLETVLNKLAKEALLVR